MALAQPVFSTYKMWAAGRTTSLYLLLYVEFVVSQKLVSSVRGEIGAGNYSHYYLKEPGDITLVLRSLNGDADLYVSASQEYATFEKYSMSSSTSGIDLVTVSSAYQRPVLISVYGHVYYPTSAYLLLAFVNYTGYEDGITLGDDFSVQDFLDDDGLENASGSSGWGFVDLLWDILEIILKIFLELML